MRSPWTAPLAVILVLGLPAASEARSHLEPGAVVKPKEFRIRSPFPCGVAVRVNCAYGTHCSPAHKRTRSPSATNDFYALDLVRLARHNGFDKSVVAVAPGVVRYAGWARRGFAPYGKIVYLEHAFRDGEGHSYQTLYAHLNRVKVSQGQRVRAGEPIGTLGGSSKRRLAKLGFHLHFAMYQDARRALGGGRAVLPEPLGHFRHLQPGMQFVSCGKSEPDRVALAPYPPLAFGGLLEPGL